MNLFRFIYKFVLLDVNTKKFSFINIFPFIAQVLGVIAIMITLTIMNGLEDSIYRRLQIFNLFEEVSPKNHDYNLEGSLNNLNIDYISASNIKLIASNLNKFIPIDFKAIDNFQDFSNVYIRSFLIGNFNNNFDTKKSIYIGERLSSLLDVKVGDRIELINPNELNFFTSNPQTISVTIEGIFSSQILNIDDSYVYADREMIRLISRNQNKSIYVFNSLDNYPEIKDKINLNSWKQKHLSFIEAYNNEKILYSSFGLIVVIISAFTLSGIIGISIRKRLVHMSILRAIGYQRLFFIKVYTYYVSLFSTASFMISLLITFTLYKIDVEFGILEFFFPPYLYFPFEMSFNMSLFIIIFFAVYIITLISTLTSISTIYKIDIAKNIKKA